MNEEIKLEQRKEEEGATMVEYGIMVVLIVVVVIVAVQFLGKNISNAFSQTSSATTG